MQLTISSPEGRGGTDVGPTLFESELRSSAAREECFLIRIELDDLTRRKIVPPAFRDAAVADPKLAAVTAETERDRQSKLRSQLTDVRRKAVAEARTQEEEMESALRAKVLEHLTGVTVDMPQWKRFVGPDQDAREVTRETQKSALQTTIARETRDEGPIPTLSSLMQSSQRLALRPTLPRSEHCSASETQHRRCCARTRWRWLA